MYVYVYTAAYRDCYISAQVVVLLRSVVGSGGCIGTESAVMVEHVGASGLSAMWC